MAKRWILVGIALFFLTGAAALTILESGLFSRVQKSAMTEPVAVSKALEPTASTTVETLVVTPIDPPILEGITGDITFTTTALLSQSPTTAPYVAAAKATDPVVPTPGGTNRPTVVWPPTEPVSTPITATFSSIPSLGYVGDMIRDYAFLGTRDIWIVVNGELLHTADWGQHWVKQFDQEVSLVAFADTDHGWIVAQDSAIFGTEDGGNTWQLQLTTAAYKPSPMPTAIPSGIPGIDAPYHLTNTDEINSISFVSALRGWASTTVELVTTADGGKHWVPLYSKGWMSRIRFMDEEHGWGFAGGGAEDPLISHTTDGGQTWHTWPGGPGCNWYKTGGKFSYTGPDTAWAVCVPNPGADYIDPMYLQKATDGGHTWNHVYSTEPNEGVGPPSSFAVASVGGLFFLNDERGWVITMTPDPDYSWQTLVRSTTDGGRSWQSLAGFDNGMYDLRFESSAVGYGLAGSRTKLLGTTDGGRHWTPLYEGPTAPHHFTFFDAQSGVGVSTAADLGAVSSTTDGGNSWWPIGSLNSSCGVGILSQVLDTSFPTSTFGWALLNCRDLQGEEQQRVLTRSSDGGRTWQPVQIHNLPPAARGRAASVSFVDERTGYTASRADGLQVTHDGGRTFAKLPGEVSKYEAPVMKFLTPDTGWIVGGGQRMTTDGGISWKHVFMGNVDAPVFDVLADGHVWISNTLFTGENNYSNCGLLSKARGETTWKARFLPVCPEEISFADGKHGWLRGRGNFLYSTTDGGDSWLMLP